MLLAARHTSISGAVGALFQFRRFERDLHRDFFALASNSGKPRGLRWVSCDWTGEIQVVADEEQRLITAYASVNLGFEAIEGGEMEDVEAVSSIRDGSAVFHFQDGRWGSAGRVVFNMNPQQAAAQMTPGARKIFDSAPA